jgi:site-specific DNA-methyltransferase (adenine-specific)
VKKFVLNVISRGLWYGLILKYQKWRFKIILELNKIYNEDCLEGMKNIEDKSIDMILCDLPYGTTKNKWDVIIPFDKLWEQYERIIKDNGVIALFSAEPFTSLLITSNIKLFKYDLIWKKTHPKGHLNAKRMPMRGHENICIFYKKPPVYNPIMRKGKYRYKGNKGFDETRCYGVSKPYDNWNDEYYPTSVIEISNAVQIGKIHPTEKPVELCEWLIKTYSSENELILDNCMGSGSTAIACININRQYIGFELDNTYYESANKRIENHFKLITQ